MAKYNSKTHIITDGNREWHPNRNPSLPLTPEAQVLADEYWTDGILQAVDNATTEIDLSERLKYFREALNQQYSLKLSSLYDTRLDSIYTRKLDAVKEYELNGSVDPILQDGATEYSRTVEDEVQVIKAKADQITYAMKLLEKERQRVQHALETSTTAKQMSEVYMSLSWHM